MSYIGTNKIGKMYLGSTAIGKAYLGSDLVYDANGGGATPQQTYVMENLVFHLDGINRGGTTGHWIDLIGGVDFVLNGCTESTDHVSFGGTGYGVTSSDLSFPVATHTIEVVAAPNFTTPSVFSVLFLTNGTQSIAFGYQTTGIITTTGNTSRQLVPISKPTSILQYHCGQGSDNFSAYINGIGVMTSGGSYAVVKGKPSIGCRMNGNTAENKFDGSIYAIRVYQGYLSAEHRAWNLAVDNQRFNMGLTQGTQRTMPSGYTQLEYVQVTNGVIATNVTPVNSQWKFDLMCDSLTTSNEVIISSGIGSAGQYAAACSNGKWGLGTSSSDIYTSVAVTTRSTIYITYTSNGITMTVGNETVSRTATNAHTNNTYLFAAQNNDYFKGKIYSVECMSGGNFDGIPAQRDSDSKNGIYDLANNIFYPLT